MPHFIIDCSENVLQMKTAEEIMQLVYDTADSTGLFAENDIKVRLRPFQHYQLGKNKENFLHIFGYIMEGRTTEQKADLSQRITKALNELLPDLSIVSMNISEFEKATYSNKSLIDPENISGDRHFRL